MRDGDWLACCVAEATYCKPDDVCKEIAKRTNKPVELLAHTLPSVAVFRGGLDEFPVSPEMHTNFNIAVYCPTSHAVFVGSRGTIMTSLGNWRDNAKGVAGDYDKMTCVQDADAFYQRLVADVLPRRGFATPPKIVFCGHSQGAGTSIVLSARYGHETFNVDPPSFGGYNKEKLSKEPHYNQDKIHSLLSVPNMVNVTPMGCGHVGNVYRLTKCETSRGVEDSQLSATEQAHLDWIMADHSTGVEDWSGLRGGSLETHSIENILNSLKKYDVIIERRSSDSVTPAFVPHWIGDFQQKRESALSVDAPKAMAELSSAVDASTSAIAQTQKKFLTDQQVRDVFAEQFPLVSKLALREWVKPQVDLGILALEEAKVLERPMFVDVSAQPAALPERDMGKVMSVTLAPEELKRMTDRALRSWPTSYQRPPLELPGGVIVEGSWDHRRGMPNPVIKGEIGGVDVSVGVIDVLTLLRDGANALNRWWSRTPKQAHALEIAEALKAISKHPSPTQKYELFSKTNNGVFTKGEQLFLRYCISQSETPDKDIEAYFGLYDRRAAFQCQEMVTKNVQAMWQPLLTWQTHEHEVKQKLLNEVDRANRTGDLDLQLQCLYGIQSQQIPDMYLRDAVLLGSPEKLQEYFRQQELVGINQAFEALIKKDQTNSSVRTKEAVTQYYQKYSHRYSELRRPFVNFLALRDPDAAIGMLGDKGNEAECKFSLQCRQGRFQEACDTASKLLSTDPTSVHYLAMNAYGQAMAGDCSKALPYLERIGKGLNHHEAKALFESAEQLVKNRLIELHQLKQLAANEAEVKTLLQYYTDRYPQDFNMRYLGLELLLEKKEMAGAIAYAEAVARLAKATNQEAYEAYLQSLTTLYVQDAAKQDSAFIIPAGSVLHDVQMGALNNVDTMIGLLRLHCVRGDETAAQRVYQACFEKIYANEAARTQANEVFLEFARMKLQNFDLLAIRRLKSDLQSRQIPGDEFKGLQQFCEEIDALLVKFFGGLALIGLSKLVDCDPETLQQERAKYAIRLICAATLQIGGQALEEYAQFQLKHKNLQDRLAALTKEASTLTKEQEQARQAMAKMLDQSRFAMSCYFLSSALTVVKQYHAKYFEKPEQSLDYVWLDLSKAMLNTAPLMCQWMNHYQALQKGSNLKRLEITRLGLQTASLALEMLMYLDTATGYLKEPLRDRFSVPIGIRVFSSIAALDVLSKGELSVFDVFRIFSVANIGVEYFYDKQMQEDIKAGRYLSESRGIKHCVVAATRGIATVAGRFQDPAIALLLLVMPQLLVSDEFSV